MTDTPAVDLPEPNEFYLVAHINLPDSPPTVNEDADAIVWSGDGGHTSFVILAGGDTNRGDRWLHLARAAMQCYEAARDPNSQRFVIIDAVYQGPIVWSDVDEPPVGEMLPDITPVDPEPMPATPEGVDQMLRTMFRLSAIPGDDLLRAYPDPLTFGDDLVLRYRNDLDDDEPTRNVTVSVSLVNGATSRTGWVPVARRVWDRDKAAVVGQAFDSLVDEIASRGWPTS